jgi:hypothetical protein
MEKNKEEELKSYFNFLCTGDKNAIFQETKKYMVSDLVFGLECYGNGMDKRKKNLLIEQLLKKGENYQIDFDEFLDLFQFKKKTKLQKLDQDERKKISRQMFFLIYQILGIDDENKKLEKKDIKQLFYIIFSLDEFKNIRTRQKDLNGVTMISMRSKTQKDKSLLQKLTPNNPTLGGPINLDLYALKTKFENTNIDLVEDLIKSIDYDDDGKISLKDFEFLMENYFNDIEKNK